MKPILFCLILAVGATLASDPLVLNSKDESFREKRVLLSDSQQTQIKHGFDAADHLFDKMDKLDFGGVLGSVVGTASSFLGAVGPFVGLFLSLLGGPDATEQLLKGLYTKVENGFARVDVQFEHLRREVSFVATHVHFKTLESNINAAQSKLTAMAKTTSAAAFKAESHAFSSAMDHTYQSAGIKLYNDIYHGGLTSGGLFQEFMAKTHNDRKQTHRFMLGCLNLLMRAASLEIAHAQLKHSANVHNNIKDWVTRIGHVKSKMSSLDSSIVHNYHTQMTHDVNDFGTLHPKGKLSNSDFASQLYSKLSHKFYWRDWFVLASAPYDHHNSVTHVCEYSQHDYHGRTIQVASVEKSRHHAHGLSTTHMKLYITSAARPGSHQTHRYTCVDCNTPWGQMPSSKTQCSTYAAAGVVCMKSTDIHIHGASGRYHSYNPKGANLAFVFG